MLSWFYTHFSYLLIFLYRKNQGKGKKYNVSIVVECCNKSKGEVWQICVRRCTMSYPKLDFPFSCYN